MLQVVVGPTFPKHRDNSVKWMNVEGVVFRTVSFLEPFSPLRNPLIGSYFGPQNLTCRQR